MNDLLLCQKLSKRFDSKYALTDVDLTLERGRIVGLLGPNGSGKTTLIKLITGLLSPTEGTITINGMAPGVETKRLVSYLPERPCLNAGLRVKDLLKFFSRFYDNFNQDRALAMLSDLNIRTGDRLKTMSKGTKEKVQLILVMSRDAELYVLDEPIGGVDPAARDYILRTILTNYSPNSTILISTHLIADIENILDDVIILKNGKISLNASVDEIRTREGKSVDDLFREVFRCLEN